MVFLIEIIDSCLEVAGKHNHLAVFSKAAHKFLHARLGKIRLKPKFFKVGNQLLFEAEFGAGKVPEFIARIFSLAIREPFLALTAAEDFLDAVFGSRNDLGNLIDKDVRGRSEINTTEVHDDEFEHTNT